MSEPSPQYLPPTPQPQYQPPGSGWVGQPPAQHVQHVQPVSAKPLPDLARGYLSLRAFTQPALGIVFPVLGVFFIGLYSVAIAALSGFAGLSLMLTFVGWLCMVAGVVSGAVIVRRMVTNFVAAGSRFSGLLWLGLLLPCLGFVLMLVAPFMTRYPQLQATTNGLPVLGLFIVCVILVPASGLAQSLNVRRVEREYGPAGVAALWALQQGQLAREPEYLAAYATQRKAGQP